MKKHNIEKIVYTKQHLVTEIHLDNDKIKVLLNKKKYIFLKYFSSISEVYVLHATKRATFLYT